MNYVYHILYTSQTLTAMHLQLQASYQLTSIDVLSQNSTSSEIEISVYYKKSNTANPRTADSIPIIHRARPLSKLVVVIMGQTQQIPERLGVKLV